MVSGVITLLGVLIVQIVSQSNRKEDRTDRAEERLVINLEKTIEALEKSNEALTRQNREMQELISKRHNRPTRKDPA